jgi:hypothetical protein
MTAPKLTPGRIAALKRLAHVKAVVGCETGCLHVAIMDAVDAYEALAAEAARYKAALVEIAAQRGLDSTHTTDTAVRALAPDKETP